MCMSTANNKMFGANRILSSTTPTCQFTMKARLTMTFPRLHATRYGSYLPHLFQKEIYSATQILLITLWVKIIAFALALIKQSFLKKTAWNFAPIILSHNIGTSLGQNHKKIWGSWWLIRRKICWNITWGLYWDFYVMWQFKKISLKFWWKFQGLVLPLTKWGVTVHSKSTLFLWEDEETFLVYSYMISLQTH